MPGKKTDRPLHGDYLYSLQINSKRGDRLERYWKAMELGYYERVSVAQPDGHPGVRQYEFYDARWAAPGEPPSLEEAMGRTNAKGQLFSCQLRGYVWPS